MYEFLYKTFNEPLYTHSALLNSFANFPTFSVWGWHTPYFSGHAASNSMNLKVEKKGESMRLNPFPIPLSLSK
jgi:hypothetical protein